MNNINLEIGSLVTVSNGHINRAGKVVAHLHIPFDGFSIVINHDSFGAPLENGVTQLFNRSGKCKGGQLQVVPNIQEYRQYIAADDFLGEWMSKEEAIRAFAECDNILGYLDAEFDAESDTLSNVRYVTLEK